MPARQKPKPQPKKPSHKPKSSSHPTPSTPPPSIPSTDRQKPQPAPHQHLLTLYTTAFASLFASPFPPSPSHRHPSIPTPILNSSTLSPPSSLPSAFTPTTPTPPQPLLPQKISLLKHHLQARDFSRAFGDAESLEAYAVRWSAGRVGGYAGVLRDVLGGGKYYAWAEVEEIGQGKGGMGGEGKGEMGRRKILCMGGGGGAEMVALASVLPSSDTGSHTDMKTEAEAPENHAKIIAFDITIIDIAPWSPVLQNLHAAITHPPPLSRYASAAARAKNLALAEPEQLKCRFLQRDILDLGTEELRGVLGGKREGEGVGLVTLMFTLNELYCVSIAKTTQFLLELGGGVRRGGLLLVVDSAGSYSTVGGLNGCGGGLDGVSDDDGWRGERKGSGGTEGGGGREGREGKRYPMKWLLDHTLLESANGGGGRGDGGDGGRRWEKLREEDSRWFRWGEVRYPIKLEDMRMQVHLYRRL